MCADLAFVWFVVTKLLMNTASGMPAMKEQEISLKLRLMVPDKSPRVSYPSIINSPSSLSNPLFSAYQSLQPPQPPAPPMPPLNIRIQPSAVLTQQQLTYDRWGGIMRPVGHRKKPSLVVHQPVVNYHYTPSAYVPPTRFVPIQVPVHVPAKTTTTTMRPIIIVTGFNTSYGVNYGYNSGGATTTTTPKPLVDFAELLKELKAGIDEKPEKEDEQDKPKECPCNETTKEFDLLKDPFFKDGKKMYDIGKLNLGNMDDEDDDDYDDEERDDYDEIEDVPTGKVAAIRNMWGGYLPRSLLQDALRQSKPTPRNVAESQVTPKQSSGRKRKIKKGMNEAFLRQFQNGLNALQETVKANENDRDIENAIKELHDSDDDDSGDNEEDESHLTHFVDFWGNRVPKYQNDLKDKEQTVQESAAEYNKDPNGWNPKYTDGLWSDDDSHLQVFSGYQKKYQSKPKDDDHQEEEAGEVRKEYDNGLGESLAANYNKYVSDNGTWLAGHYNPAGVDMSHIFNESVANERPLDNPNEKFDTYEKVVDFLNGKIPENDTVEATKQPTQSASDISNTTAVLGVGSGEMISVKDLLSVLAEKKKEREENATRPDGGEKKGEGADKEKTADKERAADEKIADKGETEDDSGSNEEKDGYVLAQNTNIPADMLANIGKPPDGALCKDVTGMGLAKNDTNNETQMSHVRGFLCVKDYDEEEEEDEEKDDDKTNEDEEKENDKTDEDKDDEEKNIEQSIEKSQEDNAE